ncbi:MAG: hypothetical protein ABFD98_13600 [Syntrophobacteraceae bacterium]|nr:hypothetical protein [Desulfobacteraceae bacterium]
MEQQIRRMYLGDCALIVVSVIFLWLVLLGIMSAVGRLGAEGNVLTAALCAGTTAGLAATVSLLALLRHLNRKKQDIYSEDILHSKSAKND